jgi:hypothetical protein
VPLRGAAGTGSAAVPQVPGSGCLAAPQGPIHARDASQASWCRFGATGEEAGPVTVSIPLVAILGLAVFVAYRYMGLRVWQAVLCLLFGFLLAATTAAPEIRNAISAVVQWLGGTRP